MSGRSITSSQALVIGLDGKAVTPRGGHLEALGMPDVRLQPGVLSLPALVL